LHGIFLFFEARENFVNTFIVAVIKFLLKLHLLHSYAKNIFFLTCEQALGL